MEDGSFCQRRLGSAIATLKYFDLSAAPVTAMTVAVAFGTDETVGPSGNFEC
jgi:hypothetical protein